MCFLRIINGMIKMSEEKSVWQTGFGYFLVGVWTVLSLTAFMYLIWHW